MTPAVLSSSLLADRIRQKFAAERFTPTDAGCWEWPGVLNHHGYGSLRVTGELGLTWWTARAHRVSYAVHCGDVPNGALVLHHCDNRRCVNPAHLFLGSAQDNTNDMHAKGRWVMPTPTRGERNFRAKLTEEQVRDIAVLLKAGLSRSAVARQFGVTLGAISRIALGKNWKHLGVHVGIAKSTRGIKKVAA